MGRRTIWITQLTTLYYNTPKGFQQGESFLFFFLFLKGEGPASNSSNKMPASFENWKEPTIQSYFFFLFFLNKSGREEGKTCDNLPLLKRAKESRCKDGIWSKEREEREKVWSSFWVFFSFFLLGDSRRGKIPQKIHDTPPSLSEYRRVSKKTRPEKTKKTNKNKHKIFNFGKVEDFPLNDEMLSLSCLCQL